MTGKKLRKELKRLVICFKDNGYTKKQIKEIKHLDGGNAIEGYIYNLEEE